MPRKKIIQVEEEHIAPLQPLQHKPLLNMTRLLVVGLIIASYFLGALTTKVQYLEQGTNVLDAQTQNTNAKKVQVGLGSYPMKGSAGAKVTIVEFADLRCPYCKEVFNTVEPQLMSEYINTGKVKFVFRNYAFLGPASVLAAQAATCANDQGKFWQFHDYMYQNQPVESDTSMYTVENLSQIAKQLGMNMQTFQSCLNQNKGKSVADTDFADGQKAGVNGTPTFYINGIQLVGAQPYSAFKTIIDQELAKNSFFGLPIF